MNDSKDRRSAALGSRVMMCQYRHMHISHSATVRAMLLLLLFLPFLLLNWAAHAPPPSTCTLLILQPFKQSWPLYHAAHAIHPGLTKTLLPRTFLRHLEESKRKARLALTTLAPKNPFSSALASSDAGGIVGYEFRPETPFVVAVCRCYRWS